MVYLEPADLISPGTDGQVHAILLRELIRQAFLMAARDGMELSTRDATIGEDPPDDLPRENRLSLVSGMVAGKPAQVVVGRGPVGTRQTIWSGAGPEVRSGPADVIAVTESAERMSRDGFLVALRATGFNGQPNIVSAAKVPEDVEADLADPCFINQFAAVRTLHARIKADGESPALIGALVRGYANLGMLTELHWGSAHKAFQARALLYAQKLTAADPASPWGLWHRAYAAALAGAHAAALGDLVQATRLATPASGVPEWVGLVDALCRFDTARLKAPSNDKRLTALAAVFRYLTVESPDAVQLSSEAAKEALQVSPDCGRIRDALAEMGGKTHRQQATTDALRTFGQTITRRLPIVPGLPSDVASVLKSGAPEPNVVYALAVAGRPASAGEVSWTVVARLINDARFAQVINRLDFLWNVAGKPVADEMKTLRPLAVGHPQIAFLDSFALGQKKNGERLRPAILSLKFRDFTPRQRTLYRALASVGTTQATWARQMIGLYADHTYADCMALIRLHDPRDDPAELAQRLAYVSPAAPTAKAAYVDDRWSDAEPSAGRWEGEGHHPIVLTALGRRYMRAGRPADAERCLRLAIQYSADAPAYELLADLYSEQKRTADWVAAIETLLRRPDADPYVSRLGVALARHLLKTGEVARAQSFAEAAAEAGAAGGLDCALECAERLGQWDRAEGWVKRTSEGDSTRVQLWFLWCHQTGRGNLAAATELVDKHLSRPAAEPEPRDYVLVAARHMFGGSPGEAADKLDVAARAIGKDVPVLLAGIYYDAAGRTTERDRALGRLDDDSHLGKLAGLFRAAWYKPKGKGQLDDKVAESLVAPLPPDQVWLARYAIARFHSNRDEHEKARPILERVAAHRSDPFASALAAKDLRALRPKKDSPKDKGSTPNESKK